MKGFAFSMYNAAGAQQATFTGVISGGVLTTSGVTGSIIAGSLIQTNPNDPTKIPPGTAIDWGSGNTWHLYPDVGSVSSSAMATYANSRDAGSVGYFISDLTFNGEGYPNVRASGIHLQGLINGSIERCLFNETYIGIWVDTSCYAVAIRDCAFNGPGDPTLANFPVVGSIGYMCGILYSSHVDGGAGQPVVNSIENCNFINHDTSLIIGGPCNARNVRVEESVTAVYFRGAGDPNDQGPYLLPISWCFIDRFELEGCVNGIQSSSIGTTTLRSVNLIAHPGTPYPDASGGKTGVQAAIGFLGQYMTDVKLFDCDFAGGIGFTTAGVYKDPSFGVWTNVRFTNVNGTSWVLPAPGFGKRAGIFFDDFRSDFGIWELDIADLPGQGATDITVAVGGMEYNIANANASVTIGSADVVGAGTGSERIKVRYNGNTNKWTCCGV